MDAGGALQKPPGYKDANAPPPQPAVRPPQRKPGFPTTGYKPKKKQRSCCYVCYCCCCTFFLIHIILLAVFAAVFYLWFDPKPPSFALQSFQVKKFDVAATNNSDGGTTSLTAQTTSRVVVANPNTKITFYYGATEVGVKVGEKGETGLGSASLPEFRQGPKNETNLKVDTAVTEQAVANAVVVKLRDDYKSKALVLNVEVATSFGVGFWGVKLGMFKVDVVCGGMTMKQLESGGSPKCKVYVLHGINLL